MSPLDPRVLEAILALVPDEWMRRFAEVVKEVVEEIRQNYMLSVKKATVDFVLQDYANRDDRVQVW